MECPFCGAEVEDGDALQDHQAFQCSAIQPQPQEVASVRQARESPKGMFSLIFGLPLQKYFFKDNNSNTRLMFSTCLQLRGIYDGAFCENR